jgi:cytochrome c-type biogenesis protein CcmH
LRRLLHQQLEAGASNDEILDYMVARYGEFVRYRPSFNSATAVLWLAPALLLLAAIVVAGLALRSRRDTSGAAAVLSEAEQQQLRDLLDAGHSENSEPKS